MNTVKTIKLSARGFKLTLQDAEQKELGHACLFVMSSRPNHQFGFMEDLFIEPQSRGLGLGTELVNAVINLAKQEGCYKLICTSRYSNEIAHHLYLKTGFVDWGKEFRLNFSTNTTLVR